MGVQGLTTQLERYSRSSCVCFVANEAAERKDNVLLVDASAVVYYLVDRLGLGAQLWENSSWHGSLYALVCRFYRGLQQTGLRLVLVVDSAPAPGHEVTHAERRRRRLQSGLVMAPTAEMVCMQAYADLGLEVLRSVHSADMLLLAWYRANLSSVFALLTNDSDFCVYGVHRVVHTSGIVIDPGSVTMQVWNTFDMWNKWRQAISAGSNTSASGSSPYGASSSSYGSGSGGMPPLLLRAQVAAILGNDLSKNVRSRLASRAGSRAAGGGGGSSNRHQLVFSPNAAARAIMENSGGQHLDLDFFHRPPLSLKSFDADDLALFNAVVQSYLSEDEFARSAGSVEALTLTERALLDVLQYGSSDCGAGGVGPAQQGNVLLAQRVAREIVPGILTCFATRGFGGLTVPDPAWSQLLGTRCAVAAGIGASSAIYEYDANSDRLLQMTPGGSAQQLAAAAAGNGSATAASAPRAAVINEWFSPAKYLPDTKLVAAGSAIVASSIAPVDRCRASLQETMQALQEAATAGMAAAGVSGCYPETLVMLHALMLHAVEPSEDAWDAESVRALLLPGVPLPDALAGGGNGLEGILALAQDAGDEEAAEAAAAAVAAAAAAAGGMVDVGSSLSKSDWGDIDAKEVVNKVRSSSSYALINRLQPWDAAMEAAAVAQHALPADSLFGLMYTSMHAAEEGAAASASAASLWKALMKACFAERYAEAKQRGGKATLKALLAEAGGAANAGKARDVMLSQLKAAKASLPCLYAAAWYERLAAFAASPAAAGAGSAASAAARARARAVLALKRDASVAGPGSIQWTAVQVCWAHCSAAVRAQAFLEMWGYDNRSQPLSPLPMRYPHQQQLMDLLAEHLAALQAAAARQQQEDGAAAQHHHQGSRAANGKVAQVPSSVPSLHIILSTPTGSGKTFTAVMLHLHMLRGQMQQQQVAAAGGQRGGDAAASGNGTGHPDIIVVYSVPTKQVLKRVGQECEAHSVVYWTAARDGDLYQVRRPYSIRTQRGAAGGGQGSGTMRDQLETCAALGRMDNDRGGGKPDFIIADIHSTAAIVRAAAEAPPDSFYHRSKLLLFFDEPNMGIHMDPKLMRMVKNIMAHAPCTAVLASATLPEWSTLPAWWRTADIAQQQHGGAGAQRAITHAVITQEPYELPQSRLAVLDSVAGELVPVSPLDLFASPAEMATLLEQNQRLRVLLLRHFTPQQANSLLGLSAGGSAAAPGAAAGGTKASAGGDDADDNWTMLGQDVRALREGLLEPELMSGSLMAPATTQPTGETAAAAAAAAAGAEDDAGSGAPLRFEVLRREWAKADPPTPAPKGIRDVLSKQGVTMIATLSPRRMALELAGKWSDPDKWAEEVRTVQRRVRDAEAAVREADKAARRAEKRGPAGADEGPGEAGGIGSAAGLGAVTLRPGLSVMLDEAREADDDTLALLAQGVAYAACSDVEPIVKRLYQQALLYLPEKAQASKQPPLHTLVVDYSAVYGTDCPAVDTIIMCEDLGALLSFGDHQQFLGRLRRDGVAIYPSLDMLRAATLAVPLPPRPQAPLATLGAPAHAAAGAAGGGFVLGEVCTRSALAAQVLLQHVQGGAAADAVAATMASASAPASGDRTAAAAAQVLALVRPGVFRRADVGACVVSVLLDSLLATTPQQQGAALLKAALLRLQRSGGVRPLVLLKRLKLSQPTEQLRLVVALAHACLTPPPPSPPPPSDEDVLSEPLYLPLAGRLLQELANEDIIEEPALRMWLAGAASAAGAPGAAGGAAASLAVAHAHAAEAVAAVQAIVAGTSRVYAAAAAAAAGEGAGEPQAAEAEEERQQERQQQWRARLAQAVKAVADWAAESSEEEEDEEDEE